MRRHGLLGLGFGVVAALGCARTTRTFPLREPVWRDADAAPFANKPAEYTTGMYWDGADQMVFRPITRLWAVSPGGESVNVNALDEVPDSTWFENRIGRRSMRPEEVARGPCIVPPLEPQEGLVAVRGKPGGANPGFVIRAADGRKYLVKFDSAASFLFTGRAGADARATSAEVLVSKLFHAAGYHVPCNRLVFFAREQLTIEAGAQVETHLGEKVPMTEAHVSEILSGAVRLADGTYRASASLYLEGEPLGPFRFEGTRKDDPNDVVPHEDRRELRGYRLISAWTGHTDAREQNSLDTFMREGASGTPSGSSGTSAAGGGTHKGGGGTRNGRGFVRHQLLDFGDALGSLWSPPMLGRRIGHAYYFDGVDVLTDWLTLGLVRRPWEELRFGPSGRVFGYFDVQSFEPEQWRSGYPNPAMMRMTERDGAWMARILARFSTEHLRAVIAEARVRDAFLESEILRILEGRRRLVLERYLSRLSPLASPAVTVRHDANVAELCLEDVGVTSGIWSRTRRRYEARAWHGDGLARLAVAEPEARDGGRVCVALPALREASRERPTDAIVDVFARQHGHPRVPARVHLYALGASDWRTVGLERPADDRRPE